eukprot:SAG22_NODE_870_length_6749_cov_2.083308_3_plen_412_part_00
MIKAGRYTLDTPLRIRVGGVVLRGEGAGGTVLWGRGRTQQTAGLIQIQPEPASPVQPAGSNACADPRLPGTGFPITAPRIAVAAAHVPFGSCHIPLASAAGLAVGDAVVVRRVGNAAWHAELRIEHRGEDTHHDAERTIAAIDGDTITVDIGLPVAIDERWGGGEVFRFDDSGRISEVGVENLVGESDFDPSVTSTQLGNIDVANGPDDQPLATAGGYNAQIGNTNYVRTEGYVGFPHYSDQEHLWNFITVQNTADVWIRDCTALHFAMSAVQLGCGVKHATVQDCVSREPVSQIGGGRRFTFDCSGQLCLVQRCRSDMGRHSFVVEGANVCGPNVFLDCVATRPYGSSEPHSIGVGTLYDSVAASHWHSAIPPVAPAGCRSILWLGIARGCSSCRSRRMHRTSASVMSGW